MGKYKSTFVKKNNNRKKNLRNTDKLFSKILFIFFLCLLLTLISLVVQLTSIKEVPTATNKPKSLSNYNILGIDVSSYQGKVDWESMYKQGVSFAFIKSTEGIAHVDENFKNNWNSVYKTPIKYGAYHFMSFESSGLSQAQNYISQVDKRYRMLPPVVDVEYYGAFNKSPPSIKTVHEILTPLLSKLESHYGVAPIIYTNKSVYTKYIAKKYNNPIWISDPNGNLTLPDGKPWRISQFTFEGKLEGHTKHKYVDLNVFNGTPFQFLFY